MANNTKTASTYGASGSGWGWYLALGILMIIFGIIALGATVVTSAVSILFFAWILLLGGIIQFFSIFFRSSNRLGNALLGILYAIVGLLMLSNPAVSLVTLTLIIAMMLTIGGLTRAFAAAFDDELRHKGWAIAGGIISSMLGVLIWAGWPESSLFTIGLFIGVDLLLNGVAWTFQSFETKRAYRLQHT